MGLSWDWQYVHELTININLNVGLLGMRKVDRFLLAQNDLEKRNGGTRGPQQRWPYKYLEPKWPLF